LTVQGCLALLLRVADMVGAGSQFVIATHSPILLAYPRATIWQVSSQGMERVGYDDAEPVRLYRGFLADPGRYLRHLDLPKP
jgi:predicted ATPase